MLSKKHYLDLVSLFLQAKPPKPHELRPCYQHELLLHVVSRPKEPLTKDELTDLVWNMTNGPKKKTSRPRRRQSGGMDAKREPSDVEVVFGTGVKMPASSICRCGWERSRIEWLSKLERQQRRQYYQVWKEPAGATYAVKDAQSSRSKAELRQKDKDRGKASINTPGCWALLPFACGWCLPHDSSSCSDVPRRKKSS